MSWHDINKSHNGMVCSVCDSKAWKHIDTTWLNFATDLHYHNPSLQFVNKAKACKGAGQEWSPRITFHVPRNVGRCEGMNLHTPKWTFTSRVRVLMDFEYLKSDFKWCTPKLLDGLNWESKGEDNGKRRSWGALPSLQHFGGRRVCWSSEMGLGRLINNSITQTNLHKPNNKLVNV